MPNAVTHVLIPIILIDIFRDYVVTINVHGTPVCFLIKNKESADSYKKYFQLLWKQATP